LFFNVLEPAQRADSVTTVGLREGLEAAPLLAFCQRTCNVVLGIGIGELEGRALRIAHMGHVNAPMILGVLGSLEVAMAALAIEHGRGGAQAAIDWLGSSLRA